MSSSTSNASTHDLQVEFELLIQQRADSERHEVIADFLENLRKKLESVPTTSDDHQQLSQRVQQSFERMRTQVQQNSRDIAWVRQTLSILTSAIRPRRGHDYRHGFYNTGVLASLVTIMALESGITPRELRDIAVTALTSHGPTITQSIWKEFLNPQSPLRTQITANMEAFVVDPMLPSVLVLPLDD